MLPLYFSANRAGTWILWRTKCVFLFFFFETTREKEKYSCFQIFIVHTKCHVFLEMFKLLFNGVIFISEKCLTFKNSSWLLLYLRQLCITSVLYYAYNFSFYFCHFNQQHIKTFRDVERILLHAQCNT